MCVNKHGEKQRECFQTSEVWSHVFLFTFWMMVNKHWSTCTVFWWSNQLFFKTLCLNVNHRFLSLKGHFTLKWKTFSITACWWRGRVHRSRLECQGWTSPQPVMSSMSVSDNIRTNRKMTTFRLQIWRKWRIGMTSQKQSRGFWKILCFVALNEPCLFHLCWVSVYLLNSSSVYWTPTLQHCLLTSRTDLKTTDTI